MAFPTFKNTPEFQNAPNYYGQQNHFLSQQQFTPNGSVQQSMTYEGTIRRSAIGFGVLLAAAALGWFIPLLALPAMLAGLVLGLVISFKRVTNAGATLSYAGLQGLVVGGVSSLLEGVFPGVVSQAVLATLCVFGVVLFFTAQGVFRTTPLLNKIFIVAGVSYLLFGLVNLVLMVTNVTPSMFGLYSDLGGWGIAIGVLGTLLASYSLIHDFEFVKNGVNNNVEARFEWLAVFSLIATLVWLYLEILRLLSLFRQ